MFINLLANRADNLVLVKFGFSALIERPSFFRRLVLDLVLKTSNSARLVLLKSNDHYAKMMMMGKTTCSDSFH